MVPNYTNKMRKEVNLVRIISCCLAPPGTPIDRIDLLVLPVYSFTLPRLLGIL